MINNHTYVVSLLSKSKHATGKAPVNQADIIYVNASATGFIFCLWGAAKSIQHKQVKQIKQVKYLKISLAIPLAV